MAGRVDEVDEETVGVLLALLLDEGQVGLLHLEVPGSTCATIVSEEKAELRLGFIQCLRNSNINSDRPSIKFIEELMF